LLDGRGGSGGREGEEGEGGDVHGCCWGWVGDVLEVVWEGKDV